MPRTQPDAELPIPREIVDAIRRDADHFPPYVRSRGLDYWERGRVGMLEVRDDRVEATVRGSRTYRTGWGWQDGEVDPVCTCPVAPICKHAYAVALAITRDAGGRAPAARRVEAPKVVPAPGAPRREEPLVQQLRAATPYGRQILFARLMQPAFARGRYVNLGDFDEILREDDPDLMCWRLAREIPARTGGWMPAGLDAWRDRPELAERVAARERERLAAGLERWAVEHAAPAQRSLRIVLGLARGGRGEPEVRLQARATTPRLKDEPRSANQIAQLAGDLRRDPRSLAPPHARVLRVVSSLLPNLVRAGDDRTFALPVAALHRLLDSLADSALATWGEDLDPELSRRAGIAPGQRMRLGEANPAVAPACRNDVSGMRIVLAARWPDGRERGLDDVVYLAAEDELHPSLVVAEGAFWSVAEEPPRDLLRRFASTGSLPVPERDRSRFLDLLASSFEGVAEALAPHTRLFAVSPVVALELRPDDWLQIRIFAHGGDAAWNPAAPAADTVAFELSSEAQWVRLEPATAAPVSADLAGIEGAEAASAAAAPRGEAPATEAPDADTWIERPDPDDVQPALEWALQLPLRHGDVAGPGGSAPEAGDAHVGAWMRLNARNLEAFAEAWERRPEEVRFLGNRAMRELLSGGRSIQPRLSVSVSGIDWFQVSAEWEAEGLKLTEADLAKLRGARTRFVKLASGWVRRDRAEAYDEAALALADLGIEIGAGAQRVTVWQLAQASGESLARLEALGADPETRAAVERLRARVREFKGLPQVAVPARVRAELRPYQREGLDFLGFVTDLGMGAILADDMGLGKTVQALAWIERERERDPEGGPVLVVCPASVVHNWVRESERFTPHLRTLALTSGGERHALRAEAPSHDLVVTNYALLRRDLEEWKPIPLRAAILDEAQNVKNPDAAVTRAVLQLQARHRLALTGTPLENRALDLWSIMQFVNPGYLGTRKAFAARFDRPDAPRHARALLAAKLRPVLLRRLKAQVARELPERIEERLDCELTEGQRKLYLAELTRSRALVRRLDATPEGLGRHRIEILSALTKLRQICCHPALAGGKESVGSGKFDALFELLEPLRAEGHKVLVFSQFVRCLELIGAALNERGIRHHVLTGSTATRDREQVVQAFETDPEPNPFLISLKAGGTGLNLTAASDVVLFDPWWNPAVEAQAIDRTHRIGQTKTVVAYRLLAEGTIEERIFELQQRKAALARDVLGEDGFARALDREDLEYLLGGPGDAVEAGAESA